MLSNGFRLFLCLLLTSYQGMAFASKKSEESKLTKVTSSRDLRIFCHEAKSYLDQVISLQSRLNDELEVQKSLQTEFQDNYLKEKGLAFAVGVHLAGWIAVLPHEFWVGSAVTGAEVLGDAATVGAVDHPAVLLLPIIFPFILPMATSALVGYIAYSPLKKANELVPVLPSLNQLNPPQQPNSSNQQIVLITQMHSNKAIAYVEPLSNLPLVTESLKKELQFLKQSIPAAQNLRIKNAEPTPLWKHLITGGFQEENRLQAYIDEVQSNLTFLASRKALVRQAKQQYCTVEIE
jgi:hypothetical protein